MTILFTHSEQFRSLFSLILRSPSSQNYSFQLSARFLQILPVHHSSILQSARHLFIHLYLNPLKYLHLFSNSSRCSFIFSSIIFNSYGSSKILLPSFIISMHLCFSNPTGGSLKTSSLSYIYLNLFYENKLYAKSIARHQFNL